MSEIENPSLPVSFSTLVLSLASSAVLAMGLEKNPQTGRIEKDLNLARFNIDMLEMLQERTKGNLSAEEERGLTQTLSMLQMNFVETAQAQPAPGAAAPAPEPAQPAETIITDGGPKAEPKAEGDDKVRYRKSYG